MRLNRAVAHGMTKSLSFSVLTMRVLGTPLSPSMVGSLKLERMFVGSDILFRPSAARAKLTGKDMDFRNQMRMVGRRRGCQAKSILCKASVKEQTRVTSSFQHAAAAGRNDGAKSCSAKPYEGPRGRKFQVDSLDMLLYSWNYY